MSNIGQRLLFKICAKWFLGEIFFNSGINLERTIKTKSLDDLFDGMSWVSQERKMAIAFATYSGLSLTQVMALQWSDQIELPNWRALFILEKMPVSETIGNVFFERTNEGDVPITLLPCIFGLATLWQNWELFTKRHYKSVPIQFTHPILL